MTPPGTNFMGSLLSHQWYKLLTRNRSLSWPVVCEDAAIHGRGGTVTGGTMAAGLCQLLACIQKGQEAVQIWQVGTRDNVHQQLPQGTSFLQQVLPPKASTAGIQKGGSEVKSTCYSSRGPGFVSQNPCRGSQSFAPGCMRPSDEGSTHIQIK